MNILLIGGRGQLGHELRRALAPLGAVHVAGRDTGAALHADLAQPATLRAAVQAVQPALIVNAAGWTDVDGAEAAPEAAAANAVAPGVLAQEAAARGAWLVHYGTDHVFDGSGSHWRDEDAPVSPVNAYGRGKLEGERAVRASGCRHLLLRSGWLHDVRGHQFTQRVLALAAQADELPVVCDQIGAPTPAALLADVTAHAVRAAMAEPARGGLYHCVAAGETSRHGWARALVERGRALGLPLRLRPQAVLPVATRERPSPAARPLNTRLETRRLRETFGLALPPWTDGVEALLQDLAERRGCA